MPASFLLRALARSLVAGEATTPAQVMNRASRMLGKQWRWLRPLAERYSKRFSGKTRPRVREVVRFLRNDPGLKRAASEHVLWIEQWVSEPQQMEPVPAARLWNVPAISSVRDLAEWFGIPVSDLEWFADLKGLTARDPSTKLNHYHYQVMRKSSGGLRLIEAPKPRLKEIQRQILARILEMVPLHPAVHGFAKGRSIKTFAAPHVGQRVLLRMDLENFFPSFAAARIQTFFRTLGYPETVSDLLGGVCTNAVPRYAWSNISADINTAEIREARQMYSRPHLPQGAPTSPALANLCAYRMDCRLAGLARSAGAVYTRYADDLAFSGGKEFDRHVDRFSIQVGAILLEEGFHVQFRKTRVMRQGVRQHLAGLVTNQKVNIMRPDFDRLKAILTNCVRLGPSSQNREGHPEFREQLAGKVSFIETINPGKGKRLRALYQKIVW
ncbi:MAG TPA: reverse transcriptase family protein [Terriglobales bacterium]|nr:reverse transcriptase family protein [Terriglobales bacterium]